MVHAWRPGACLCSDIQAPALGHGLSAAPEDGPRIGRFRAVAAVVGVVAVARIGAVARVVAVFAVV